MDFEAFYLPTGAGSYLPTAATTSPWDGGAQHGGPPAALLATAIDAAVDDPELRLARMTVEFLGAIPRRELTVAATVVRPGRRIAMSEASMVVDARPVAIARAWHLRTGAAPPPETRRPSADVPALPAAQPQLYFPGLLDWGYGESIEWRFTVGGLQESGPAGVWTHVRVPLIAGTPLTGLQRMLVVADAANGVSTELPLDSWWFIPPGITVNLLRHTEEEWVHLAAETDVGVDGIGLCVGNLADSGGALGQLSQPLLVSQR